MRHNEKVNLYALYNEPAKGFVGFTFTKRSKGVVFSHTGYSEAIKFKTRSQAKSNRKFVVGFSNKDKNEFYKCKTLKIVKLIKRVIHMEDCDASSSASRNK